MALGGWVGLKGGGGGQGEEGWEFGIGILRGASTVLQGARKGGCWVLYNRSEVFWMFEASRNIGHVPRHVCFLDGPLDCKNASHNAVGEE